MGEPGEDMSNTEKSHASEDEKDIAKDELKGTKMVAEEANMKLSDVLTTQPDVATELDLVKLALSNAKQQLKVKDKKMTALKSEAERAKELQEKLNEKENLLDESRNEVNRLKSKETRIRELEEEIHKREESEAKLLDFMAIQTKQLEQTKIALEESKLSIANLSTSCRSSGYKHNAYPRLFSNHELESLRSELRFTKENLCHAEEGQRLANLKVKSLIEELSRTKNELKTVSEAEENGKRAMDDLAVVLKEVATESNQAKEKLNFSQREIEKCKSEAAQAKFLMKSMENKYKSQLEKARKEAEQYKNTSERLRMEVDESNVAWHDKETMFVKCIKAAEEENVNAKTENKRLVDALSEANQMITKSKEEIENLRDILKQALNESNVAKEAAGAAREENSLLKDSVAEKDSALEILTREIEDLRAKEEELKRLLCESETSQNGQRSKFNEGRSKAEALNSLKVESKEVKVLGDEELKVVKNNSIEKDPKDVSNSMEKQSKDVKKSTEKDPKDTKILKDDSKEIKILKEESKVAKILKEEPPDVKIPKVDKDPKDVKIPKDKESKDAKIAKEKDHKDAKIPRDPKDPKLWSEKENNLNRLSRNCSLNLKDVKVAMNKEHKPPINKDVKSAKNNDYDFDDDDDDTLMDDPLKGSIFDTASPVAKATPPQHKKSLSLSFADDRAINVEDFEHEENNEYEMEHEHEHDKNSRSKRRPLFRRFGNMLSRKSFIRRESGGE